MQETSIPSHSKNDALTPGLVPAFYHCAKRQPSNLLAGSISSTAATRDHRWCWAGVGTDVGIDLAAGVGTDLTAGVGADVGTDVGVGVGTDVGIDLAAGVGTDLAAGVGTDVAAGVGADVGTDVGGSVLIDEPTRVG